MTPDSRRHALLASLVALTLAAGCATPADVCGFRHFDTKRAVEPRGAALVEWEYGKDIGSNLGMAYRNAKGDQCVVMLKGEPPTFNDICALAIVGHEVLHCQGGRH